MKKDKIITNFKKNILPQIIDEYNPKDVIVYGSRVKGTASSNSDLDVIIVSDAFQEIPFIERMPLLLKKYDFPRHIDYICYTIEEFNKVKNASSLIIDALEYGESISSI